MKADREAFIEQIRILDRDALLSLVASLYDEMEETRLKYLENERISTEAHMVDMMPWSDAYRQYEKEKHQQQQSMFRQAFLYRSNIF